MNLQNILVMGEIGGKLILEIQTNKRLELAFVNNGHWCQFNANRNWCVVKK